ncbi:MAG: YesL family protein [Oscillospiraceae bacterium]|nr:YesL family protein [Oscillospiraceae bacterium]
MNFFSPDSKFTKVMTSFGEMMLLNLCWIVASLPIVTIGASNTAMYTVMGRRHRNEGSGTIRPFFKAWWHNLKTSTLFWLVQIFMSFSLGLSLFLTLPLLFKIIAAILLVLVTLVFSLIYPQIARFRNGWFAYLRNAVILLVLRLGWVVLNFLLILSPVILFLLIPYEFLQFGFIWILFGFSVVFHFSADMMQKILKPLEELSDKKKFKKG